MKLFKTTSQSELDPKPQTYKSGPNTKARFSCSVCDKSFSSKQCLKEHNFKHSNEKPYGCIICKKRFRHASQYTVHKQVHRDLDEFYWPQLAEMEKKVKPGYLVNFGIYEKLEIPLISQPQVVVLPDFLSIFRK